MRALIVVVIALFCAACEQRYPIAVVGKDLPGGIMRGEAVATLSGGTFSVSGGRLRCAGDYPVNAASDTITIPVLCNDGRKGIVNATRDRDRQGGGGRFTLSDGTTGDFIFGPAAARL